mmetsp:Transcript_14910/g.24669  ORF Transcript_14910/g.24669 Transcript_14910/m.24669 type:complete len:424 (-) Transcript_14910:59-1330(-)|eukprot:CAMPEP_0119030890 /NCGR_PEP_ID=MMETSP1176-20130426/41258_1 /TAXON_ID=265551 /ORGANISM="Synedropsis recta cf, Strain CCMP1620" /LENGTH=423 /DNA_ID=CAMNT_0006987269 /DNA_START=1269 /DNA_END=2540 /DNA_ORIENTATION=-
MVSAFHAPYLTKASLESVDLQARSPTPSIMEQDDMTTPSTQDLNEEKDISETEDEEVKMNCVGGVQPYMTTTDEDDFKDDDDSCCSDDSEEENEEERGVVNFVSRQMYQAPEVYRPQPMLGRIEEEGRSSDSDASSSCSDEAAVEMDDEASAMSEEESSDADDERSDDGSDDDVEGHDEENDEASTSDEMPISLPFSNRPVSPTGTQSHGTPEVCDEDDRFFDYDDHCIDIIDKVLAMDASQLSSEMAPSPRSKRILSSLFNDDDPSSDFNDTPKRMRSTTRSPVESMTSLFLGPSAYEYNSIEKQREFAVSPFSEEEQDRQLSAELQQIDVLNDRESTPVPLLSPPPSPLCVESDKGQLTTVCEWPCNLAIDSALTMITGLRAHSPASLARLDMEEEDRIGAYYGNGTSLTPLLQGIRVDLE